MRREKRFNSHNFPKNFKVHKEYCNIYYIIVSSEYTNDAILRSHGTTEEATVQFTW